MIPFPILYLWNNDHAWFIVSTVKAWRNGGFTRDAKLLQIGAAKCCKVGKKGVC